MFINTNSVTRINGTRAAYAVLLVGLCPIGVLLGDDRSIDGTENNLRHTEWGSAVMNFRRVAPSAYGDGVSSPAGENRPNARFISNRLFAQSQSQPNRRGLSGFVYQFGQFISHDMQFTLSESNEAIDIQLPENEEMLRRAIRVSRSLFVTETDESPRPREQINFTTSFLDASAVYWADSISSEILRGGPASIGAKLKTSNDINFDGQSLLPRDVFGPRFDVPFVAGDTRVNENINLTAMHILFMREHNRLVDELSAAHPEWNEEQLYQRARKTVGAEIQSITFNEFLPALLGQHSPGSQGTYDESLDPTIANEFASVVLRLGHSMLPTHFLRIEEDGTPADSGPISLEEAFSNPSLITFTEDLDALLRGLAREQQEEVDIMIVDALRGIGLGAIDIQRGRDHGLTDYNSMRAAYGLPRVSTFEEITSNGGLQDALRDVYFDVSDIDPFVGALSEDHLDGASVGPLAAAVMIDQFTRLRDGDRFWFANDAAFTPDEIATLHQRKLSDVIRRNTGIRNIQDNVFFVPEPSTFILLAVGFLMFHFDSLLIRIPG